MTNKNLIRVTLAVVLGWDNCQLQAQTCEFGLEYNSEWQTNFEGDYNWVNLLKLSAMVPVTQHLAIMGSTISIARTSDQALIDDMQGYSNIVEDNLPLAFAVLGAQINVSQSTIFVGIKNVNEDYFTSPVTSFFVNSSCGIFPTIAGNYDIANYPLSSWCLHYKIDLERVVLQTSLYEGQGHKRIAGHDNMFTFSPRRNGLFSITSAEYNNNGSNYTLGCAVYYGMRGSDDLGVEEETASTTGASHKTISMTPWINLEQRLSKRWELVVQGSLSAPKAHSRHYTGLGAAYQLEKMKIGLFVNHAKYADLSENAIELTCALPLASAVSVQPSVEMIRTGCELNVVGMVRVSVIL